MVSGLVCICRNLECRGEGAVNSSSDPSFANNLIQPLYVPNVADCCVTQGKPINFSESQFACEKLKGCIWPSLRCFKPSEPL